MSRATSLSTLFSNNGTHCNTVVIYVTKRRDPFSCILCIPNLIANCAQREAKYTHTHAALVIVAEMLDEYFRERETKRERVLDGITRLNAMSQCFEFQRASISPSRSSRSNSRICFRRRPCRRLPLRNTW